MKTQQRPHRLPFGFNPRLASKQARLHRLVRAGKAGNMTKEQMRAEPISIEAIRKLILRDHDKPDRIANYQRIIASIENPDHPRNNPPAEPLSSRALKRPR
jgi:hypothetical protein